MTNIFDTLDKKKLSTKLYPDETISFLSDLLSLIGENFDPYKKFNDQFLGKTKDQYETMVYYILEKFADIKKLRDEEGSVKFILSKVLESIIFKNLETIYFYNLYGDSEKRIVRTQLERALDHIYQCNLLAESYILADEINKVVVDGVIVTIDSEIKKALQTTMKKNRYIYSVKTNSDFNKSSNGESVREVYENLESINLERPTIDIFNLSEVKFTTSKDYKQVHKTNDQKLESLLLDENSFYLSKNGIVRQNTKLKKVITKVNFQNFEYQNGKLIDSTLNLSLGVDPKVWNYYLALVQTGFIRVLNGDEVIKKDYPLSSNLDMYESLLNVTPGSIYGITKYGENQDRVKIESIEVQGRVIKGTKEIYQKLQGLDLQDVFKVTYEDGTLILGSKDLNYFFLLNLNLVNKISIGEKDLSLEQVDQLGILPTLTNGRSFQSVINMFLEYELEDYLNEYEDIKMLEIISKNFSKNDIIKYTREYKTKIDKFEETLNISKLLPKSLHD